MRHFVDFYTCLLRDIDRRRVNYDRRERDPQLESDRNYSLTRLRDVAAQLEGMLGQTQNTQLWIRTEALGDGPWARSSLARELQTLLSHTVHHYAIIGVVLRAQGFELDRSFGVAPSTLRHWQKTAAFAS